MANVYLTTNRYLSTIIFSIDVIIAISVVMFFEKMGRVLSPHLMLMACLFSMFIAETAFSCVVYKHYSSIDKVLSRTSAFLVCYTVGLLLCCSTLRVFYAKPCDYQEVGWICFYTGILIFFSRLIEGSLIKFGRRHGRNSRSIAFVGEPKRIMEIMEDIDNSATTGLRFTGYYSMQEDEELGQSMDYYGDYAKLSDDIDAKKRISDDIYCALPGREKALRKRLATLCMETTTHFFLVPTYHDEVGSYLRPSIVGNQVVFANFTEPLMDPANRLLKRTFDIVCSGIAILCLLPFMPFVIIGIELQSPGNPFFGQVRTGLHGKDFKMWKFRSMRPSNTADTVQATKDDPRKFPFGNFLRRSSIDELPQLWNIFIGDMSIVGPRPHMKLHTEEYGSTIKEYMMRHYVRPGLTGWAQVTGFRGETDELWKMEGRVKKDIWYIQNWTFWLDIRIIVKTAFQVLSKDKLAY